MKNTITTILLLISAIGFSQEIATTESGKKVKLNKDGTYTYVNSSETKETVLKDSDFTLKETKYTFIEKPFFIIDGDDKIVDIKLIYSVSTEIHKSIPVEKINFMISMANIKTKYSMKNKRTFVPKKISMFFSEKSNEWLVGFEYVAQNDYGATKDGTSYVSFEKDGTFKSILIP